MPKLMEEEPVDMTADKVKPFAFHGLDLNIEDKQAVGDCPFCSKERKFTLNLDSGLWRCWVCGAGSERGGGNVYTFFNLLWQKSKEETTQEDYQSLCEMRGLLDPETPKAWGAAKSAIDGEWLVPGFNAEGKLCQLYRWVEFKGKKTLMSAKGTHHGMFRIPSDPLKKNVTLIEGYWNCMAFWEVAKRAKEVGETVRELGLTGADISSLLHETSIVGTPGCNVFREGWEKPFEGKNVTLIFDSDHPKGSQKISAGAAGMERVAKILARVPAESIKYAAWGEKGYAEDKKDGFDVRDQLSQGQGFKERLPYLTELLNLVQPIPDTWLPGRTEAAVARGGTEIECCYCPNWKTLIDSWRFAMYWTEGLDRALSMMLASVLSTRSAGDQLWMKILGPPSCGKSTLCEAISVNKRHVKAVSTIRGFHSGYRDPESGENSSLILKLANKCLVTKDGDTILQMTDRDRILSEARDLYDTTARSDYRNGMGMDHEGIRMTWLLCGTEALRVLDRSQLGARFLDCVILRQMDHEQEDSILDRVINRAARTVGIRTNCTMESQHEEKMLRAMQLTGGYINTICDNDDLLMGIDLPFEARLQIKTLGRYVASMRARPSISKEEERHEKELPSRLVSQHVRLAMGLAGVLSKNSVDSEVMRRVRQTSLDTSEGRTTDFTAHLHRSGTEGLDPATLSVWMQDEEPKVKHYLRFLGKIGVAEHFKPQAKFKGQSMKVRWRLTQKMSEIWKEVHHA